MVARIPGLEHAKFIRYGYAIEYDMVWPHEIRSTLETRKVHGLFLAGQINGTSGYEEAAAQGLMAGMNAVQYLREGEANFVLRRDQAYIGVLVDDLVTKPPVEPYRMFTSRAEHRLLLRERQRGPAAYRDRRGRSGWWMMCAGRRIGRRRDGIALGMELPAAGACGGGIGR